MGSPKASWVARTEGEDLVVAVPFLGQLLQHPFQVVPAIAGQEPDIAGDLDGIDIFAGDHGNGHGVVLHGEKDLFHHGRKGRSR